ncbi:hypothetical protein CKO15_01545 [Halorhodospira abdelmalekii]|uniref:hypothetical protein n=1 Tax=Halorhodospira abdelmalekii TaxID=421629 RepID=UPI001905EEC2|nr:hypothetical protein [Halorhodospira abdelmalekii]MBK1733985.1 hypothetical protein [Halorhodospira abdelmalekii]
MRKMSIWFGAFVITSALLLAGCPGENDFEDMEDLEGFEQQDPGEGFDDGFDNDFEDDFDDDFGDAFDDDFEDDFDDEELGDF